jgi:hypothetical protein
MTDDITALRAALTHGSRSLIWDACNPDRIARLLDRLDAAERALARIADLDASIHSEEGYNEWGEADCFHQARDLARAAMQHTEGEK